MCRESEKPLMRQNPSRSDCQGAIMPQFQTGATNVDLFNNATRMVAQTPE